MKKKAINCFVSGRVQGVGFRMATSQKSKLLGITGWVRNLTDGRVEVYACGKKLMVDELCSWLAHGPNMAKVLRVEYINAEYREFNSFSIH
ncbi:MAG: acylphosphatase [Gammaproteobacteria bacterium]